MAQQVPVPASQVSWDAQQVVPHGLVPSGQQTPPAAPGRARQHSLRRLHCPSQHTWPRLQQAAPQARGAGCTPRVASALTPNGSDWCYQSRPTTVVVGATAWGSGPDKARAALRTLLGRLRGSAPPPGQIEPDPPVHPPR
jgi:hypothetical protein